MRFGNPAAWLGLGLLVLPILVHMLVRDRAPLRRLPTLRFLEGEPPVAVRRARPDEPLLLLLRLAILALAVVALARPYLPGSEPVEPPAVPYRVVLLDESRTLSRPAADGSEAASERARALAEEAAEGVPNGVLVPFGPGRSLATALEGAVGWLESRPGPGEVVIVSDFRLGLLDEVRMAEVPEHVGLAPIVVEVGDAAFPDPLRYRSRAGILEASVAADGGGAPPRGTVVTWSFAPESPGAEPMSDPVRLAHDPSDEAAAQALLRALDAAGGLAPANGPPVTVVFAGADAEPFRSPADAALSPDAADLALRLASDPFLAEAGRWPAAAPSADTGPTAETRHDRGSPLVRGPDGRPVVEAVPGDEGGLLLLVEASPGSVLAAALLDALGRLTHAGPPGRELEQARHPGEEVEALRRAPTWPPPASSQSGDASAGGGTGSVGVAANGREGRRDDLPPARWAWLLVLGLLVGEGACRRRIRGRAD